MPGHTFEFPLGDLRGQAYALGTTHVGLVLPIAGVGMVSVVVEIGDAKRLAASVECAVTSAENVIADTGLGESAVEAPAFDPTHEAERVLASCGIGVPRPPAEDR